MDCLPKVTQPPAGQGEGATSTQHHPVVLPPPPAAVTPASGGPLLTPPSAQHGGGKRPHFVSKTVQRESMGWSFVLGMKAPGTCWSGGGATWLMATGC